jgi:L-2,4-diaminobutyric acid acetyltransferase
VPRAIDRRVVPPPSSKRLFVPAPTITLRPPAHADGAAVYELVRDGGGLDLNTPYAYLLLTRMFAASSVVAEAGDGLAGVVLGLRPPDDSTTLFVWQVGVAPAHRGEGLGLQMLRWLIDTTRPAHLEATVTPANTASDRLFRAVARHHDVPCEVTPWASIDDFPGDGHAPEDRYRIGPLPDA